MIARPVGSVTIAASARTPRSINARVPRLSNSSSATAAITISPSSPASTARAAAAHIAATPAFMSRRSAAVDPARRAPCASNGACDHSVDADDVEMPVEHQDSRHARASDARDDVRPSRRGVARRRRRSPRRAACRPARARQLLRRAARHERRIARVDAHQLARQRDARRRALRHRVAPSSSIVNGSIVAQRFDRRAARRRRDPRSRSRARIRRRTRRALSRPRRRLRRARDDFVDQRRRDRRMQRSLMRPLFGDERARASSSSPRGSAPRHLFGAVAHVCERVEHAPLARPIRVDARR